MTYYCYDDTGSNYTYLYTTTTDFVVGKPVTFHINKQIKDNVAYTELATSSGGGGGYQWNINGGAGSDGECLVKFVKFY